MGRRWQSKCLVPFLVCCLWTAPAVAEDGSKREDWPFYGGDSWSSHYSPLDQIHGDNVSRLQVAWRWQAVSSPVDGKPGPRIHNYEATPIKVGERLYTPTGSGEVAALDAATGKMLWLFTPQGRRTGRRDTVNSRGVAFWSVGEESRVLAITPNGRLFALDPGTGRPFSDFGQAGEVDLNADLGRDTGGGVGSTSPPIVVGNVVVVGSTVSDGATRKRMPPGHVRGYDVRSGKLAWIFHTIPQSGEAGVETWENESWRYTGNTNVWSLLSADLELGYVYLPLTTPTNDWYGGHRLGDNLYAESLVCLDAKTGKRVWHFQMVHHGLWDYDLPAAPNLVDLTVDGERIKAVVQVSKQGFAYVLDRVTGKPVWPIEERPVPQSDVPGERTSPTQPFPTRPPPFERQGITVDDLIDFTPELRAEALTILKRYRHGPLFTPPSLLVEGGTQGTLQLPGWGGGANWPGAAVDPRTGTLYVPSIKVPIVVALGAPDASRSDMRYTRTGEYYVEGPQGLPLLKPPYGRITAIDLNRGEHLWSVPNGDSPAVRNHPLLKDLELPALGQKGRAGALVTRTLLFVTEGGGLRGSSDGAGGPFLRAYDKASGAVLHEIELPGNATGVPMTYAVAGRQLIVVATGTREKPAELVALALPAKGP